MGFRGWPRHMLIGLEVPKVMLTIQSMAADCGERESHTKFSEMRTLNLNYAYLANWGLVEPKKDEQVDRH